MKLAEELQRKEERRRREGGEKDRIVETREVDALKDGRVIKREHKGMNIRHGRQTLP